MLQRKAASAGGGVIEIKTRHTRLSQFDHTTGEYIKKPLSQRVHVFGDGRTEPVQRDLYSAFLATCCDTNLLDIPQVKIAWASAEPLLRTAMSSVLQPASGKGFAQPHVRNGVRAGRRIKRVGPAVEAGDDVVPLQTETARAPERLPSASLRTPGFSHGEVSRRGAKRSAPTKISEKEDGGHGAKSNFAHPCISAHRWSSCQSVSQIQKRPRKNSARRHHP